MNMVEWILLICFFFDLWLVWWFNFKKHSPVSMMLAALAAIFVGISFLILMCTK